MGPYCRYCHSADHALMNCDKENTRISCFNCNILGHLDKDCPHRNGPASLGTLHKKARKVPNSSNMSPIIQVMSNQPAVVQKLHSVSSMSDGNNARGILEAPEIGKLTNGSPLGGTSASKYTPRQTRSQVNGPSEPSPSTSVKKGG